MRGMRFVAFAVSALAVPCAVSAAPQRFSGDIRQVEAEVLATFNLARTQPATYVNALTTYRGFFKANAVVIPGQHYSVLTEEGRVPVDEAIAFMRVQEPLGSLASSETLRLAAADHLAEQGRTGGTGHYGADGSSPADRVARRGGGNQVAEVVAYGARDAKDIILQLIVDDGVADRGHRIVMFLDHLAYAGVACGPHPQYGTMCVIDMADTPDGASTNETARVHVAAMDGPKER